MFNLINKIKAVFTLDEVELKIEQNLSGDGMLDAMYAGEVLC